MGASSAPANHAKAAEVEAENPRYEYIIMEMILQTALNVRSGSWTSHLQIYLIRICHKSSDLFLIFFWNMLANRLI